MEVFGVLKQAVTSVKQIVRTNWWLKITTAMPSCTYYFGPFRTPAEAEAAQSGYIDDLETEGAQGIAVVLEQCRNPGTKTICHENS